MQQSSATPKHKDVGRELRKSVACSKSSSSQCFLFQQFLARCHPYILFLTCFTHFFPTVSFSTNRGLPSQALRMVNRFLPSTDGYTWIATRISLARTLYIRSCASPFASRYLLWVSIFVAIYNINEDAFNIPCNNKHH